MDKNLFWQIIDTVNNQVSADDYEGILRVTQEELCKYSWEDVFRWYDIQGEYVGLACKDSILAAFCILGKYITDSSFLDFRTWLVSRGRDVYMAALNHPDSLADLELPTNNQGMVNVTFEQYGYVAMDAYETAGHTVNDFYAERKKYLRLSSEDEADLLADIEYFPRRIRNHYTARKHLPKLYAKYITSGRKLHLPVNLGKLGQ